MQNGKAFRIAVLASTAMPSAYGAMAIQGSADSASAGWMILAGLAIIGLALWQTLRLLDK